MLEVTSWDKIGNWEIRRSVEIGGNSDRTFTWYQGGFWM